MAQELKKKYGLPMAIASVMGIVIGSGVFFKGEKILSITGGDLPLGILAWIIGGIVMIFCAYGFAILASRHEKVSGIVDYSEALVGKKYGYFMGWFVAVAYYPTIGSVLAWATARYICVLFDFSIAGPQCLAIAGFLLVFSYAINALSPVIAGKVQVSSTVIKLIPLILMAVVGTIKGFSNGMLVENFTNVISNDLSRTDALFKAVIATAFSYEGWIIATTINAELKDAKRTLPKALIAGTIGTVIVYVIYYIGLAGSVSNAELIAQGETAVRHAFSSVFGQVGGTLMVVFVIISCYGTLNGIMIGATRALYSCSVRNQGPKPEMFKQVDPASNMPTNSSIFGLLCTAFWLLYFYGSVVTTMEGNAPWFGKFSFDSSELPIVTLYAMYIPIFVCMMYKEKGLGLFKGKIVPLLAIIGAGFMTFAAVYSHGIMPYINSKDSGSFECPVLFYMIVFIVIMAFGAFFMNGGKKKSK